MEGPVPAAPLPPKNRRYVKSALIAALVTSTIIFGACDPTQTLTYENETPTPVQVFKNGVRITNLKPQESKEFGSFVSRINTFEARDELGRLVYRETLTREELEDRDWTITIIKFIEHTPERTSD